jgi:predicted AAA+ superfamily ATPase
MTKMGAIRVPSDVVERQMTTISKRWFLSLSQNFGHKKNFPDICKKKFFGFCEFFAPKNCTKKSKKETVEYLQVAHFLHRGGRNGSPIPVLMMMMTSFHHTFIKSENEH